MSNKFNTSNFSNFEIFNDENLGSVRTLTDENEQIWFLGNDVAECLGYPAAHYSNRVTQFTDESDRKVLSYCDSPTSGESKFWQSSADRKDKVFINEAGVYAMIFLSRKPKAIEFKDWILHTVIPSIREHGGYIMGQEHIEDKGDQNLLLTQVEDLTEQVETLNIANAVLKAQVGELEAQNKEFAAAMKDLRETSNDALDTVRKNWTQTSAHNKELKDKCQTLRRQLKASGVSLKKATRQLRDSENECSTLLEIIEKESKESIRLLDENMRLKHPAQAQKYKEKHSYSERPLGDKYFVDSDGTVFSDGPSRDRDDR